MSIEPLQRLSSALFLICGITAVTIAADSQSLTDLKAEKARLEKRLAEIDAEIERLSAGDGVKMLGMTVADPNDTRLKLYKHSGKNIGPIVIEPIKDLSYWPPQMAAEKGSLFWLVEHPGKAFLFNEETSASHHPKTVRQLIQAILDSTVSPEEYRKLWDLSSERCRQHAEAAKDKPKERERLLKAAQAKMPKDAEGKYICRVVFSYPGSSQRGSMTTHIKMKKEDLDHLRKLLGNSDKSASAPPPKDK